MMTEGDNDRDEVTNDDGEDEEEENYDDEYEAEGGISKKLGYVPKRKKWNNYSGLPNDTTPVGPLEPTSATTQHFRPAPVSCIHRKHKQKRVQLTNRGLILDLPVPSKLIPPL